MEELLPDLPQLVPGLGLLGVLTWFLVRLMRQSSHDRTNYQQDLASLREQQATALREQGARHDGQIAELRQQQTEQMAYLRGEVTVLREDVAKLRTEVESERRLRWKAEDAAARYRRQLGLPEEAGSDG